MPNSIERDVYVLRDTLKNPISYVRGTDLLPIILHFRDFAIPSGATAKVFVAKNDGNAVYGGATITGNDVTVDVTQQMFITLGVNLMQVEIDSGDETLVTFEQPVMVTPNLKAGDLPESTTDIEFLDEAIEQAQEAVKDAQQAIADANTAISGANTAAESANSAAQNANNAAEELQDKVDAGDFTASVQVGNTTTLDPDQDATVSNSGTNKDAVLNFGIPKGDPGTAASIQVGTTQTVQPEENAEVNNSGTTTAAVLNFKIPRGKDGMTDLTAEYKDDSSYTCQPTVNAPVVVKELDGKTEQVETDGNQLFDIGVYNLIASRCNITQDGDYIIFKATDADAYFGGAVMQGQMRNQGTIPASPNTEYTVTISNNYFTKNYISFLDSNKIGIQDYLHFTSQSQSFTTPDNCAYILLRFGNENSANGDTERFQIMFNKGPTALPWELYTGGQPAPSPDYLQVIKGVGGMGYFDGEWRQGAYQEIDGVASELPFAVCNANKIACNPSDNIKIKYYGDTNFIVLVFYKSDGTYLSGTNKSVLNEIAEYEYVAPANASYFNFSIQNESSKSITPSTAKYCTVTVNGEYQTGVEVTGKNLVEVTLAPGTHTESGVTINLRPDGSYTLNGTASSSGIFRLNQPPGNDISSFPIIYILKQGKKYRLSCCQLTIRNTSNPNGTTSGVNAMNNDVIYTPTEDTEIIGIRALFINGTTYNSSKVYYPGIWEDESETDTEWQPFKHTALTIPITSPLYEGDKLCYVKPGESYVDAEGDTVIADRILYGVYRENAVAVFDGSEDEAWIKSPLRDNLFGINISNKVISSDELGGYIKCDKLMHINNSSSVSSMPDNSIKADVPGSVSRQVYVVVSEAGNEISAFKTWLQSNPLTVLYKLAQPYFEPFVDQAPFYTLRTDDTLSYVYSNDPIEPVLTVEVAKNSTGGYLLESYAQAQKNAISEANSQSRISTLEQQLISLNTSVSSLGGDVNELNTNAYMLKGGTAISASADMNSYVTPGNYYCSTANIAETLLNCPFTTAFTLKVSYSNGYNYPQQTFKQYDTNKIAVRTNLSSSGGINWSEYTYLTPTSQS